MAKLSVIVPCRFEPYMPQTVNGLLDCAEGDIEILVVFDGSKPEALARDDKRVKYIYEPHLGLRNAINKGAALAKGKYFMKIDAHCAVGEGFDTILKADCEDNWVVIPRRFWFDAPAWTIVDKPHVDAMYYIYPFTHPYRPRLTGRPDRERAELQKDLMLVEDMSFQGSLWLTPLAHFKRIGGMCAEGYGVFAGEPEEIGLKTQLGPWHGQVMRNKNTWFAHWSKPNSHWINHETSGHASKDDLEQGLKHAAEYWFNNRWLERAHDFGWLVDKFWPLPQWPEDWRTRVYDRY